MKKPMSKAVIFAAALIGGVLAAGVTVGAEKGESKAKTGVIRGELVDSRCYLGQGKRGPDHVKCAVTCAKDGLPMGLVDSKGRYYTLVVQANQIAENAGLRAEVEGMLKHGSIIPAKIRVNKDGTWTEVKLPEQMM